MGYVLNRETNVASHLIRTSHPSIRITGIHSLVHSKRLLCIRHHHFVCLTSQIGVDVGRQKRKKKEKERPGRWFAFGDSDASPMQSIKQAERADAPHEQCVQQVSIRPGFASQLCFFFHVKNNTPIICTRMGDLFFI